MSTWDDLWKSIYEFNKATGGRCFELNPWDERHRPVSEAMDALVKDKSVTVSEWDVYARCEVSGSFIAKVACRIPLPLAEKIVVAAVRAGHLDVRMEPADRIKP